METLPPKSGFQEKNLQEVPGRSLAAKSELIIRGIKNIL